MKLLLKTSNIDVTAKTTHGWSALLWAASNGHEAVAKLLLDTGKVDVNATTANGWTPLLLAVQNRHKAVVELLQVQNLSLAIS
jgi:ankyrin repeat protein